MAEGGEEAQDVARRALDASLKYSKLPEGGAEIAIHISTTNIRVAKELCKLAGYVFVDTGVTTLGVLLGYKVLKPLVESAVTRAFGEVDKITPGSLRVVIHCLTEERFLEVFDDYETGKMKTRLKDGFAQVGIEVEGLKVKIENIEEVNKTKEEIYKKRNARLKEMTTEGAYKYQAESSIGYHLDDALELIEKHGISGVNAILEEWKEMKIRVALVGQCGVGKSALVNAIRGIKDDDEVAAKTGVVETTFEPHEYEHPANSNITFVDLPGLGTPNNPDLQTFCEEFRLEEYDVFLIVSAYRITEYDVQLARIIKSIRKAFFFIRTNIDLEISWRQKMKDYDECKILNDIREDISRKIPSIPRENIFLISNYHKKWDLDRLTAAISDALPHQSRKRENLMLFLSNKFQENVKRKVAVFRGRIWKIASVSAASDAVSLPGFSIAVDINLLLREISVYKSQLALPDEDSSEFREMSPKSQEMIRKYCITSAPQLIQLLSAYSAFSAVKDISRFIPFIGPAIAGGISFLFTYHFLHQCLDELEGTALTILDEMADEIYKKRNARLKEMTTEAFSTSAKRIKKKISPEGGVMKLHEAVLRIGGGCLAEDTEITMINDSENSDFKSLVDLDLISAMPNVFQFLPDGLKFLKPADLTIRLKRIAPDLELFLLRGSYNHNYQKMIWELVAGGIDENRTDGVINVKIDGFSVYTFFSAMRGLISRILSHLNCSFTCVAYAFSRKLPPMDKIDIAVVLVSEFVDEYEEKDIKQLKDHLKEGYVRSDKGMAKRVETDRSLQMHLDFSGIELSPFVFEIDKPQLDSIGYVIDHFKSVSIESPARGNIKICEKDSENENLWILNLNIYEERTNKSAQEPDDESKVVHRMTKLTRKEIARVSRMVATDWNNLAGLLNISYEEREEIRTNYTKYPDSPSKAEEVLKHFNDSDCFDRDVLAKSLVELGRRDLKDKDYKTRSVLRLEAETDKKTGKTKGDGTEEMQELQIEIPPGEDVKPLSPREMYRLSRRIAVDWESLAGLMDIAKEERDDIRYNVAIYSDNRSRAEKILSIFNRKKDFSRKKLVECLEELGRYDLSETIITGKWKAERLKVEIENIEEVNKTKKEIYKKRSEMATEGKAKTTMEIDVHPTKYGNK